MRTRTRRRPSTPSATRPFFPGERSHSSGPQAFFVPFNPTSAAGAARQAAVGGEALPVSPVSGPRVQLQPTPTPAPAPAPAPTPAPAPAPAPAGPSFSVDRAAYLTMVNQAIAGISGQLVEAHTLAGAVRPILARMAAQAVFRTSTGTEVGGGTVSHTLPGTPAATLTLRLVLADDAQPTRNGSFNHTGATTGEVTVFIRRSQDQATIQTVLFHEALHMMEWIISEHGASRLAGEDQHAVRALTLTRFAAQTAGIRSWLERLADGVNRRRQAAGGTAITPAQLDSMASWLMEETQVRAETLVFRLFMAAEGARRARGPTVTVLPSADDEVTDTVVDHYVFDFSRVFAAGDRGGLTNEDREILRHLRETLQGFVNLQVRRRFSWSAYGPSGNPRQEVEWTPPPLSRPQRPVLEEISRPLRQPPF